jgi:outer membrane protein W
MFAKQNARQIFTVTNMFAKKHPPVTRCNLYVRKTKCPPNIHRKIYVRKTKCPTLTHSLTVTHIFAKNVRQTFIVTYVFPKQNARQTLTVTYMLAEQNVPQILTVRYRFAKQNVRQIFAVICVRRTKCY